MKLETWRKGRAMSQEALAEKLGITQSHICKIEQGKARPSADLANELQRLTDGAVTLADLLPKKKRSAA